MNLRQNSFIQDVLGKASKRICCFVANGLIIFMQILFATELTLSKRGLEIRMLEKPDSRKLHE